MRKSEIEADFETIRLQCEASDDLECETQLCDNLNCICAREHLAGWVGKIYKLHFMDEPIWWCTLYMERDVVIWNKLEDIKIRNIKTRFKRFLRGVGLGDALIMGVLDVILIAPIGLPGNPPPRWHFHWHFFIRTSELTRDAEILIRSKLKKENAGPTPFVKEAVTTEGFWTAYLWKPSTKIPRRLRLPNGRLSRKRRGYVKGRYLGAIEAFMIRNSGLTWLFLQGLRRSSGRVIVTKCAQQGKRRVKSKLT